MKKASITITSDEIIGNNHNLTTSILLRLPTKPLLKFKCVSKQWLSLISSPDFCLSHTRHRHHHHQSNGVLTPTALLLKWQYTLPSEFDVVPLKRNAAIVLPFFDYMNRAHNIKVLQSCYGLLLCGSVFGTRKSEDEISRYFICNPTTKKFKELSFPRQQPFLGSKFYVSLAFDPLESLHYKIICVRQVFDEKYELDIFSSETDSWSLSRISFAVTGKYILFEDAVFCNGKIHWSCYWEDSLYFDVGNERLEPLPMPKPTMEAPEERNYFGECRGVLYIAVTYSILFCGEFDVFEMASDYSHWFLKHRLYIGDLVVDFPCVDPYSFSYDFESPGFTDVCVIQFEKEEEPKVVVWKENKVIFYDLEEGAWKSLYDLRPALDDMYSWDDEYGSTHYYDFILPYQSLHAFHYFENLSSI